MDTIQSDQVILPTRRGPDEDETYFKGVVGFGLPGGN
jgi:hypothetical protein